MDRKRPETCISPDKHVIHRITQDHFGRHNGSRSGQKTIYGNNDVVISIQPTIGAVAATIEGRISAQGKPLSSDSQQVPTIYRSIHVFLRTCALMIELPIVMTCLHSRRVRALSTCRDSTQCGAELKALLRSWQRHPSDYVLSSLLSSRQTRTAMADCGL